MAATVVAASPLALFPSSANAATTKPLPKSLVVFAHCPVDTPHVSVCVAASTGGSFKFGTAAVTLPSPAVLNLGFINNPDGTSTVVVPTDGTPGLVSPPIPVPGGLIGIGGSGVLAVTATPTLTAVPSASLSNLFSGKGTAITLPLMINLGNPLLGSTCSIGTPSSPVTINLTTGTTSPPPPAMPITGAPGTLSTLGRGVFQIAGVSLVDNTFPVPGASGCGPFGLFDGIVDLQKSLPAAPGVNSAILSGTVLTAPASLIKKYLG